MSKRVLKRLGDEELSHYLGIIRKDINMLETNWDILVNLYGEVAKQAAEEAKAKIGLMLVDLENLDKTRGLYVHLSKRLRDLIREFKKYKYLVYPTSSKKNKNFLKFLELERV